MYLIRHEQAEPDADGGDAYRALTSNGRLRMRRTSRFLAEQVPLIDHIWTSPLVRAVQTAEILAEAAGLDGPVAVRHEIAHPPSLGSVIRLADDVPAGAQGVAIVGHEPTLSGVVQTLLGGTASWPGYHTGAVVAFDLDRVTSQWTFRWHIRPDGPQRIDTL